MKTNTEWREWGRRDPLFGVSIGPGKEKGGANPWTDEEFYALGAEWSDYLDRWQRYGLSKGAVLEIGCGAGRITKSLAATFERVIACDVSDDMLQYGKQRIAATNVTWQLSDGVSLPVERAAVDAVYSCHVFQHFESAEAQVRYFDEVHRALRPGGTFMIHLPVHAFPWPNRLYSALARVGYRWFLKIADVKAAVKRWRMKRGGAIYMHGISHELEALNASLGKIGFAHIEFITFPVGTTRRLHTCVLGTKQ